MTDEQKMELIRKSLDTLWGDFTAEEQEFLEGETTDPHTAELFRRVWEERPGTLEYTLKNAPCTPAELETTAKTLRALWDYWKANGGYTNDLKEHTVLDTLELIDRRVKQCKS